MEATFTIRPYSPFDHLREHRLAAERQADHVDIEDELPVVTNEFPNRQVAALTAGDAGVVYQDVRGSEFGFDIGEYSCQVGFLGQVADEGQSTSFLGDTSRILGRNVEYADLGASASQSTANRLADALAATGDHGNPSIQPKKRAGHGGPLYKTR